MTEANDTAEAGRGKISVCIITGNERKNIRRCLESVKWADEIVVVDSFSTDGTAAIVDEYTSRHYFHRWIGYIGQKSVAKSLARIHRANLINFGIAPLTFADPADYGLISQGDELRLAGTRDAIAQGQPLTLENLTSGATITVRCELSERERQVLVAGGLLNAIRIAG